MNLLKKLLLISTLCTLSACTLIPSKPVMLISDGFPKEESSVIVSMFGNSSYKGIFLVIKVDGKNIGESFHRDGIYVEPGQHKIKVKFLALNFGQDVITTKSATAIIEVETKPKHSYVPSGIIKDGQISFYLIEKDSTYPKECFNTQIWDPKFSSYQTVRPNCISKL